MNDFKNKLLDEIVVSIKKTVTNNDNSDNYFKTTNNQKNEANSILKMINFVSKSVDAEFRLELREKLGDKTIRDFYLILFEEVLPISQFTLNKLEHYNEVIFKNHKYDTFITISHDKKDIFITGGDLLAESIRCDTEDWHNLISWMFIVRK